LLRLQDWKKHHQAVPPTYPADDQLQMGLLTVGATVLSPVDRMACSCLLQTPGPLDLADIDTATCTEIMQSYLRRAAKLSIAADIRGPTLNPYARS
jgi:hypothetical protein